MINLSQLTCDAKTYEFASVYIIRQTKAQSNLSDCTNSICRLNHNDQKHMNK